MLLHPFHHDFDLNDSIFCSKTSIHSCLGTFCTRNVTRKIQRKNKTDFILQEAPLTETFAHIPQIRLTQ